MAPAPHISIVKNGRDIDVITPSGTRITSDELDDILRAVLAFPVFQSISDPVYFKAAYEYARSLFRRQGVLQVDQQLTAQDQRNMATLNRIIDEETANFCLPTGNEAWNHRDDAIEDIRARITPEVGFDSKIKLFRLFDNLTEMGRSDYLSWLAPPDWLQISGSENKSDIFHDVFVNAFLLWQWEKDSNCWLDLVTLFGQARSDYPDNAVLIAACRAVQAAQKLILLDLDVVQICHIVIGHPVTTCFESDNIQDNDYTIDPRSRALVAVLLGTYFLKPGQIDRLRQFGPKTAEVQDKLNWVLKEYLTTLVIGGRFIEQVVIDELNMLRVEWNNS